MSERKEIWHGTAMAVEFESTTITTVSETADTALIEFGRLKTDSPITGFSVRFKRDEIPYLIKMLQQFNDSCF